MAELHSDFNASMLLRIANKNAIRKCWRDREISFGCPANWIHYAQKGNLTTGDPYECVFSRIPKGTTIDILDRFGIPLEDNLQRFPDADDPAHEFLRYVPTILTPTLCFYSLSHANLNDGIAGWNENKQAMEIHIDKYAQYMEYKTEDIGLVLIQDIRSFIDELQSQIPLAIKTNGANLTQERYYISGRENEALFADIIDYSKHERFDEFNESPNPPEEIFWKFPEYRKQAELRMVIPHWNFKQSFDPKNPSKYDPSQNYLTVKLPNLQSYAGICIPSENIWEGGLWER